MMEYVSALEKGGIVTLLTFVSAGAFYVSYKLFERVDRTQNIFTEIKHSQKRNNEIQGNILKEMQINNKISESQLENSRQQLESSNKLIDLHSKIIGSKLDDLNKNIDELKYEIRHYENKELRKMAREKV
ncbi:MULTISPECIES: hypothetical protein [Campylobacter]|uniref:Uncharacterized protein n=1 Tax=Campylobacter molothri TaxID=1032242 RepID=A0ACC5W0W0_9BACT|nr:MULTISPECIES: hypothetical protein [Campylobacter]MBZ7942748.1 hypothetical protein [Campylobacter sp. W0045]MBZ7949701.1 hypothetical protein [Campylobacter sp. RM10534]MBZ7953029.1 hypothetical protein [Campylobacter sp. RM9939]MBZ7974584.1 hypothetical protein [Campylobacter sp. RM9754]EKK0827437.1 hypothetical protein [Campylobacter jejuni]